MKNLIVNLIGVVVICLIIGAVAFVVDWLIKMFGAVVIIPVCTLVFILTWTVCDALI